MLAFLERMREQHKDDDEVLVAINEVENEINEKKYGLVWEEHSEEVEERMVDEVPIFVEDKDKEITMTDNGYNFLLEGDNLHSLHLLEKTHREKIDVIYILIRHIIPAKIASCMTIKESMLRMGSAIVSGYHLWKEGCRSRKSCSLIVALYLSLLTIMNYRI